MAQRTAFLNSDAQGYNKDFHHTTLHNYLLSQVGVMFSDMVTKTEFVLGDGQITAGSAVVKCTRATGAFAGKEILALFESTAVESISTAGDKKVFIEIPEGYVNDSTTITDTLTQGINLGVGIIRSESDYPSHSNYIPLWEITGGDWAAAVDVRPEIKRFGKKNSLSFFDDNGKETSIELNSASINKFLMSNGPGNAPTMEDAGSGIEVLATKTRYIAGEVLAKGSVIFNDIIASFANATTELNIGDTIGNTMRSFQRIGNGEAISDLGISLKNIGGPSDSFEIRLETDNAGKASGTLIDVNATGLIAGSATSGTLTNETITWAGAFTPTDGVVYHIVLKRSGSVSGTNYYVIGVEDRNTRAFPQHIYDGTTRGTADVNYTPYLNLDGVYSNLRCKTKADNADMVDAGGVCTAVTAIGAEFVVDVTGISNAFTSLEMVDYYLSDTAGEISVTPGTINRLFGIGVSDASIKISYGELNNAENIGDTGIGLYAGKDNDKLQIRKIVAGQGASLSTLGSGEVKITADGQKTWDAIVAADGSGDYTLVGDAIDDDHFRIFIMPGTYNEVDTRSLKAQDTNNHAKYLIQGSGNATIINMHFAENYKIRAFGSSNENIYELRDFKLNMTLGNESGNNHGLYFSGYRGKIENVDIDITVDNTYVEMCYAIYADTYFEVSGCRISDGIISANYLTGNKVQLTNGVYSNCRIALGNAHLEMSIGNNIYFIGGVIDIDGGLKLNDSNMLIYVGDDSDLDVYNSKDTDFVINITEDVNRSMVFQDCIGGKFEFIGATGLTYDMNVYLRRNRGIKFTMNFLGTIVFDEWVTDCLFGTVATYQRLWALSEHDTSLINCGIDETNGTSTMLIDSSHNRITGGIYDITGGVVIDGDYNAITGNSFEADVTLLTGSSCNAFTGNTDCDEIIFNTGSSSNTCVGNTSLSITDNGTGNQVGFNT